MKALVWPIATHGCESWTFRKNEETRLDAFEMNGLRKILQVSWTAKKTNVLNKAGVKRKLLDTVKARKLAYHGLTMRKQGSCLEKEIMLGKMSGAPQLNQLNRLRSSSSHQLLVPPFRLTTVGRRTFPVAASLLCNSLPSDIQSSLSLPVFRQRLKTFLFRWPFPDIVL